MMKFKILKKEILYKGYFQLVRFYITHEKFAGGWVPEINREILERPNATAVLPYDPVTDSVVLIEQFRTGAIHSDSPWLIEIIAGIHDADEDAETVAKREAKEESGIELLDICPIYEYFVSPGGSDEYLHLYCARVDASDVGGLHGLAHEHEDIRAFVVKADEAFALIESKKIRNATSIIALQWLQLNRERLRKLWQTK